MVRMKSYSSDIVDAFNSMLQSVLSTGTTVLPGKTVKQDNEIISMAKEQDVVLLLCYGIQKAGGQLPSRLQQELIQGVYHYTQNEYMLNRAREAFNKEGIQFMPLKGSVIQRLYPEPWTRRSCDIDILVHEKDLEKAVQTLIQAGFKTDEKREYHDISLHLGNTHLELHFNICENIPRIDNMLSQVWKYSEPINEYEYCETSEFFAFHIIAHLLYHFLRGGSSIKQFIDLWMLRHKSAYDEKKLRPFLSACKLETFYEVICEISDIWFEGKKQTDLSRLIENRVFNGGIENRHGHPDAINIAIGGGMKKFILKSIFLPKREMEWIYPSLKKYPMLLPAYYGKRLLNKTIGKDRKRAKDILKANKKPKTETDILLHKIGLS